MAKQPSNTRSTTIVEKHEVLLILYFLPSRYALIISPILAGRVFNSKFAIIIMENKSYIGITLIRTKRDLHLSALKKLAKISTKMPAAIYR